MGAYFGDNMGSYCNSSRLRCRAARITLFSFIARGFKGMLFQESFFKFWMHSRVYFDIIL